MKLEEKINSEMKLAMKSGDKIRLDTLRSIRASIIEFNKSGSEKELDEQVELKILLAAAKKRKDAIPMYEKGGRADLVERETKELSIIEEFLPKQMSEEEVSGIITKIIADSGAEGMKDMGKVMGLAMKELSGKADGNLVQNIVREKLG